MPGSAKEGSIPRVKMVNEVPEHFSKLAVFGEYIVIIGNRVFYSSEVVLCEDAPQALVAASPVGQQCLC